MDFTRKRKRGMSQKTRRLWLNSDGYRITWRNEAFGVAMPAAYQACVKVLVPGAFEDGHTEMWDFVESRHLHRSMRAAVTACEKHARLWTKATQCTGVQAIRKILGDPRSIPKWAAPKFNKHVLGTLLDPTPRRKQPAETTEEVTNDGD